MSKGRVERLLIFKGLLHRFFLPKNEKNFYDLENIYD
jgi:hypothetical protein